MQSTEPGLLTGVPPGDDGENVGGGTNCMPGFDGTMIGGCVTAGVTPNCPGTKLGVPVPFGTLTLPLGPCTEKPDGSPLPVGSGKGALVPVAFGDAVAEADAVVDGAGDGVGSALVITALPRTNDATLTAA